MEKKRLRSFPELLRAGEVEPSLRLSCSWLPAKVSFKTKNSEGFISDHSEEIIFLCYFSRLILNFFNRLKLQPVFLWPLNIQAFQITKIWDNISPVHFSPWFFGDFKIFKVFFQFIRVVFTTFHKKADEKQI